jgi:hypothetical protein
MEVRWDGPVRARGSAGAQAGQKALAFWGETTGGTEPSLTLAAPFRPGEHGNGQPKDCAILIIYTVTG